MDNIKRIDDERVEIDGKVYRVEKPCMEVTEKKDNRFKPIKCERYFYIDTHMGDINYSFWKNNDNDIDLYSIGNCFRTEEEAEFAMEKLKVLAELSEFTEPKNAVYDSVQPHWYMYYSIDTCELKKDTCYLCKYDCALFESESDVENAIEAIGEDRIKKYLFGIDK